MHKLNPVIEEIDKVDYFRLNNDWSHQQLVFQTPEFQVFLSSPCDNLLKTIVDNDSKSIRLMMPKHPLWIEGANMLFWEKMEVEIDVEFLHNCVIRAVQTDQTYDTIKKIVLANINTQVESKWAHQSKQMYLLSNVDIYTTLILQAINQSSLEMEITRIVGKYTQRYPYLSVLL